MFLVLGYVFNVFKIGGTELEWNRGCQGVEGRIGGSGGGLGFSLLLDNGHF